MSTKRKYIVIMVFAILCFAGCKERFEPNLPVLQQNYLVVEGFIDGGEGPTRIKLSRTTRLDESQSLKPELNASVFVEGDDNSSFALSSIGDGTYFSSPLFLSPGNKYRIRIKTGEGKEYFSEFVAVKKTPGIDSISWKEENNGVQIYANTHDAANNTIYYRWDYDETWEIQSAYYSAYRYVDEVVRGSLPTDPNINNCWKYDTSSSIMIGSSAKLKSDIMHLHPLLFIPSRDERIGVRYSINVRQYALDKEGYEFMEQMKKNTESLGTIFDPQPSALRGNIKCLSNPEEQVIGYISATTVEEKRIFINSTELKGPKFRMDCPTDTVRLDEVKSRIPTVLPYDAFFKDGFLAAYLASNPYCVDCRLRGTNVKPSFW